MPENTRKKPPVLPLLPPADEPGAPPRKSGRGRIRAGVLIFVHLIILLHITHYLMTGRSVSPVEPSEAMYTIELGQVNAGAVLFGLAIVSTAVFGRFFCGWACHIVALQDLCGYVLRRLGMRPKPFRSRLLVFVPFALAFYMFFWPTVLRLWRGDTHPGFSNYLMTENFWYTFPGPVISVLTFAVCGGLIVWLLGNKGFCTYACPYGAFFSVADRVAPARIRVTDACHQCGQCTANCTSNVMVHAEVRDYGMVVDPGCMKCMDCVSICPNGALYYGLAPREESKSNKRKPAGDVPQRRKSYDFSLTEELSGLTVAGFSVFALRGLYDIVPLLLSVAVAVITGWLVIQIVRVVRRRDVRVQYLQLKRERRITPWGWAILVFAACWFAFIAHSAVVQFYRYHGRYHLTSVAASWPDLLDGRAQPLLTPADHAHVDAAMASFTRSDMLGLAGVVEVKVGLAAASLMKDDVESAEKYLREGYECNPARVRDMIQEFFVSQHRPQEAREFE